MKTKPKKTMRFIASRDTGDDKLFCNRFEAFAKHEEPNTLSDDEVVFSSRGGGEEFRMLENDPRKNRFMKTC